MAMTEAISDADQPWRLTLGDSEALFVGRLGDVRPHRHPVACLLAGFDGPIVLRTAHHVVSARAIYVAAGVAHALACGNGRVAVAYFEPDHPLGPSLARVLGAGACALEGTASDVGETRTATVLARSLLPTVTPAPWQGDPRVMRLMRLIRSQGMDRPSQLAAARAIARSPSTMLRLFHRDVGATFRRYKLWAGMRQALVGIARGDSFRAAGLDAGFADAAHFSRRFRETFGVRPTEAFVRDRHRGAAGE